MHRITAYVVAAILSLLLIAEGRAKPREETNDPPLPASGYVWLPQIAPRGPVGIVIDLRAQRAHVYRNGVRIALSRVSTGRPGFETPAGVYTILEKKRTHTSNLYDDAPMPFMQRLTWSGIALHAGAVPDHPASHGCIRLPLPFAERLFGITCRGMTVIVSDEGPAPGWVQADLLALPDNALGARPTPMPHRSRWSGARTRGNSWYCAMASRSRAGLCR